MSSFDDLIEQIDTLHADAEELRDAALIASDPAQAARWREDATRKIRQAARLRSQMEAGR